MLFLTHIPAAPLNAFVEQMWFFHAPPRAFAKERLMPKGAATIIFNLEEDEVRSYSGEQLDLVQRLPGAALTSAQSQPFVIDTAEQTSVMGIEFHPGGTWPFFAPAGHELTNQHISLRDLWRGEASALRERLLATTTTREKFSIVESALYQLAVRPLERNARVDAAVRALTAAPHAIGRLSELLNISARRFSRQFAEQVGLKPKTFARIQRFQRALAQVGSGRPVDWASVVAQCGYYDQAHFIHEFRTFSGFSPSEYAARYKLDHRHVPLD